MREFYMGLIALLIIVGGCVSTNGLTKNAPEKDIKAIMADSDVTEAKAGMLDSGKSEIDIKDNGDRISIVLTNPLLTQKGDSKGEGLKPAVRIKLASGILDAARKNPYFAVGEVKEGKVTFNLPNFAKAIKAPVVEHIWGYGEAADGTAGYLVLDPNNTWVSYKTKSFGGYQTKAGDKADLETLAIGFVMYPDKSTIPLKSLGKGKLVQGKHPELK